MRKLFISLSLLVVGIIILIFALVIALLAVLLVVVADELVLTLFAQETQRIINGRPRHILNTYRGRNAANDRRGVRVLGMNYSRSRKSTRLDTARRISRRQAKARSKRSKENTKESN